MIRRRVISDRVNAQVEAFKRIDSHQLKDLVFENQLTEMAQRLDDAIAFIEGLKGDIEYPIRNHKAILEWLKLYHPTSEGDHER